MGTVLNQQAAPFVEMVDGLALKRLTTRYSFMVEHEYEELLFRNVGEAMKVYWTEMLERAHIASVTSILRSRQWLAAVLSAESNKNVLMFAGAFRGLLESAADSTTSLVRAPLTLASNHSEIVESLVGGATTMYISSELENELIHYSHGRYIDESEKAGAPPSHWARRPTDYLKVFDDQNADGAAKCYRRLCDLTNPGAPSVLMWLKPVDATGSELVLSTNRDESIISSFLNEYDAVALDVLMLAFNAPLLVLNTLNYFPIRDLHTPRLLNWRLEAIPAWAKCKNELESRGARVRRSTT